MSKEEKKVELEEGKKYVVKDGNLVLEEEPKKEEPKEEVKEEPEKELKKELEEEPKKEEPASEVLTKAGLSEALTPLIDTISELKAEIVNAKADAVEDTTVQMSDEEKPKYKFALQWILGRK